MAPHECSLGCCLWLCKPPPCRALHTVIAIQELCFFCFCKESTNRTRDSSAPPSSAEHPLLSAAGWQRALLFSCAFSVVFRPLSLIFGVCRDKRGHMRPWGQHGGVPASAPHCSPRSCCQGSGCRRRAVGSYVQGQAVRGSCIQPKNPLNISEKHIFLTVLPSPLFPVLPPHLSQSSHRPNHSHSRRASVLQVAASANSFFYCVLGFFLSFSPLFPPSTFISPSPFFFPPTVDASPSPRHHHPEPYGPRGCEARGGSGGCGGLCIDALITHGLRLTSLLPGKQSPWLLALLLQSRL